MKEALESFEYRPEITLGAKKSDKNPLGAFVPIGDTARAEQISLKNSFVEKRDLNSNNIAPQKNAFEKASSATFTSKSPELDKPLNFSTKFNSFGDAKPQNHEGMSPKSSLDPGAEKGYGKNGRT